MPAQPEQPRDVRRYMVVLVFMGICFVGLLLQLASLQLVKGAGYRRQLDRQSVRVLWLPALRGKIFDRNMQLVADNRLSFDVDLMVSDLSVRQRSNTVKTLAVLLRMPESTVWSNIMPDTHFPYTPARVARDLSFAQMLHVAERLTDMPGVDLSVNPVRTYPFGNSASHAIGYVGNVFPNHPKLLSGEYSINDLVGINGIEKHYEYMLHGSNGTRIVQVDRASRFVETLDQQLPINGQDIKLTLDMKLQRTLEDALSNRVGAAAAVCPSNGAVLALVSSPSFDLNTFVGGLSHGEYNTLVNNPYKPLLNRATCGQYQLGSAFKLITSIAALEAGVLTPSTVFNCVGGFDLGARHVDDFRKLHHGSITIVDALRVSCNSFFCTYSLTIGVTRITECARMFRLGARTGIEIDESAGLVPDSGWKRARLREDWRPGDTVNLSIGQGFLMVTPLQVACMVGAIGNGGIWYPPRLILATLKGSTSVPVPPAPSVPIPLKHETIATLRKGMWEVVNARNGSGQKAQLKYPIVAGKTGSALQGTKTFGWFAGFAPFDDPQIAIAVVVEDATTGGADAAPIVQRAIAAYFNVDLTSNVTDHSSITD